MAYAPDMNDTRTGDRDEAEGADIVAGMNDVNAPAPPPAYARGGMMDADGSRQRHVSGAHGQQNVALPERIASGVAGAALASYAISSRRNGPAGAAMALAGGYLLVRGMTGYCPTYAALRTGSSTASDSGTAVIPHGQGVKVEKAMSIAREAGDLYRFWRNFENLPRFMQHLESVTTLDTYGTRSHWVAKGPFGKNVEWDAEIINEVEGEMIAWRSLPGADVANTGSVHFRTLPAGRGTEVRVNLEYNPPAGLLGAAIAKLWHEEPNQQVQDDLRRFKNLMEAGEIPTITGQPQGNAQGHSIR